MRSVLFLLFCFSFTIPSYSVEMKGPKSNELEKNDSLLINDGPYIFIETDNLIEKSIIEGKVVSKKLALDAYTTTFLTEKDRFENIKKIAALSDIHGQFDLAIKILKINKIIDKNLKWNFGKGHLVIVGDIFDRGPKVTETLWFIYNLEQEAIKKGGKVHFLLGNHEYMILHSDERYLNDKYRATIKLLDCYYSALFDKNTVLGRWLRSKSTILEIDNYVFVHGGISQEFLSNDFNITEINAQMILGIDREKTEMKSTSFWDTYYGSSGPIWYRGYFRDDLSKSDINKILKEVDTDHIIVGHCSNKHVVSLYDNKIFGVDSSIKKGKKGEILFIKKDKFSRGTKKGKVKYFN